MMLRLLTGIVLAALAAGEARAQRIVVDSVGTAATSYMLDGQSAPTRAYALRRLLTSYSTNKLINIVRASDSATTDIGFDSTGAIDTATATTFCNATTCKVVTLYDQSGNASNLTQASDSLRPAFVFSCLNAYPCVQLTGTTLQLLGASVTPATGVVSLAAVANRAVGTGNCALIRENGNNNRLNATNGAANSWSATGGTSGAVTRTALDAAWHSGIGVINGASSVLSIDGTENTGTATGNTTAGTPGFVQTVTSTCNIVSAIFWDNIALSATERTMITNNQRAWWGF